MCAGLIPGANIRTRPRVMFIFTMDAIDQCLDRVSVALMGSPHINTSEMYKTVMDQLIPPLSSARVLEEEAKRMRAIFDEMARRNKKK